MKSEDSLKRSVQGRQAVVRLSFGGAATQVTVEGRRRACPLLQVCGDSGEWRSRRLKLRRLLKARAPTDDDFAKNETKTKPN